MASRAPSALKTYGGNWKCYWRDSSGTQRWKNFGNTKSVSRAEAQTGYLEFLKTWTPDVLRDDYRAKSITVAQLAERYADWADKHYKIKQAARSPKAAKWGSWSLRIRHQMELLSKKFGRYLAKDFRPAMFRELQEWYVSQGYGRGTINGHAGIIKKAFKWGVEREFIPPDPYIALLAVENLKLGRTDAAEPTPVLPVEWDVVVKTMACAPRIIAGMMEIQWLTGMRPGEASLMRGCDIDMTDDVWSYVPRAHKTEHLGKKRTVWLGPKAQAIVKRFLVADTTAYLFSSSGNRKSTEWVNPGAYLKAVTRACKRAGVEHWSPNQLRHSYATRIRKQYGLETAGIGCGQSSLSTTQIYAEADENLIRTAMLSVG